MILKKALALLFMIFILAGCGTTKQVTSTLDGISFDADIEYGDYECECFVKAYGGGLFNCTVKEPKSIAGTTVEYNGSALTVTYMGITYTPQSPFPCENISDILNSIMTKAAAADAAEKRGEEYIVEGKSGKYDYTITVTDAGLPIRLKCEEADLTVDFSNVTILKK